MSAHIIPVGKQVELPLPEPADFINRGFADKMAVNADTEPVQNILYIPETFRPGIGFRLFRNDINRVFFGIDGFVNKSAGGFPIRHQYTLKIIPLDIAIGQHRYYFCGAVLQVVNKPEIIADNTAGTGCQNKQYFWTADFRFKDFLPKFINAAEYHHPFVHFRGNQGRRGTVGKDDPPFQEKAPGDGGNALVGNMRTTPGAMGNTNPVIYLGSDTHGT
jgi:hypothetical protein